MNTTFKINRGTYQGLRFGLYLLVILLFNAAVSNFPIRFDLTKQQTYSLAPASKTLVAQLEEPVTIRVYLSSNLPSEYNILYPLLRDLLQTYHSNAKRNMFSYSINLIRSDDDSENTAKLQDEAQNYGIYPVQLQVADGNEFKAVSAYLGLAISQGESLEVISPLQPSDNIQYILTAALQKMSRKGSAILSLNENLKIYYYFSPLIGEVNDGIYAQFPQDFIQILQSTSEKLYGRVEGKVINPDNLPPGLPQPGELDLAETEISVNGTAQKVYSALVIDNEGRYTATSLLQIQPTFELGNDGFRQVDTINVINPLQLEDQLAEIVIGSLGIAQTIGYISDRQTASFSPPNPQQPSPGVNLADFAQAARDLYNFQPVKLDEGIGKDINVLMLVEPLETLDAWDLYQIDQFVMRGGRLIVAMQPYQTVPNPYGYGPPMYIPNPNMGNGGNEGEENQSYTLIDVLKSYGIEYKRSMVFDKNSFISRGQNPQTGAYQENQIYFIPEINAEKYSDIGFIQGLKLLYSYNSAPLESADGKGNILLTSSEESWTEQISENMDPTRVVPPAADTLSRKNLLISSKGVLTSFFKEKEIPEKPEEEQDEESEESEEKELLLESIQDAFIEEGEHGQVLVSGTSLIFDSQLISVPTNRDLALNLVDYMAGNTSMADLRARSGVPNFIDEGASNVQKNIIKWFNILGLPLMVSILGLIMFIRWRRRQTYIRTLFDTNKSGKESS